MAASTTQIAVENVLFKGLARSAVTKDDQLLLSKGLGFFYGHTLQTITQTVTLEAQTVTVSGGT